MCSASPGLFTTFGHIMVLAGITSNGKIMVNDPNGKNYKKDNLADGYKNVEVLDLVDLGKGKTQGYSFIEKAQKAARELYLKKYKD